MIPKVASGKSSLRTNLEQMVEQPDYNAKTDKSSLFFKSMKTVTKVHGWYTPPLCELDIGSLIDRTSHNRQLRRI